MITRCEKNIIILAIDLMIDDSQRTDKEYETRVDKIVAGHNIMHKIKCDSLKFTPFEKNIIAASLDFWEFENINKEPDEYLKKIRKITVDNLRKKIEKCEEV